MHTCVCVCVCMYVGSTVYLDKAHRVLHDVLSSEKVESLVFDSNCRVENPHWHAGHHLPDVADTVVSLHGAHDLMPLANPPDGEDEVLVGSASVGVAGCQHGLPWPPLVELQGEDIDLGSGHALPHSHAPQHVDAAVQGDGRGLIQPGREFGKALPPAGLSVVQQDVPGGLLVVLPSTQEDEEVLVRVSWRDVPQRLEAHGTGGTVQGKHLPPGGLQDGLAGGRGLQEGVVGDEVVEEGRVDVLQPDLPEQVLHVSLPGLEVMLDPNHEGLEHLLLLPAQPIVAQVVSQFQGTELLQVSRRGHLWEIRQGHLPGFLPEGLTAEDFRESGHAQAVAGGQLALQEGGAGLEQLGVL